MAPVPNITPVLLARELKEPFFSFFHLQVKFRYLFNLHHLNFNYHLPANKSVYGGSCGFIRVLSERISLGF